MIKVTKEKTPAVTKTIIVSPATIRVVLEMTEEEYYIFKRALGDGAYRSNSLCCILEQLVNQ